MGVRTDPSTSRVPRPHSTKESADSEGAGQDSLFALGRVAAWTHGELARAAVFAIYIVLQIAVPLRAFAADVGNDRYSWRMYARLLIHPEWVVTLQDGSSDTIPIGEYSIHPRGELEWESHYPAHLCSVVANAREVWRPATRFTPEVRFECR